jgi:RNA polymerase sigma factor (sigma-70 family)
VPDRDIVAAIIAGDPAGLAAAYDSYAAGLFGYCRSLLGEPADAADAVQDTFVIAAVKLSGLRNPARFRSWLYAVARNECHGRLRAQARQANPDQAGEMTDDVDNVVGFAQRDELRRLMTDAIAGLNPGDREVIELNLRHDLGGADLAGVLGVPAAQAHALASRARAQLERALGALLVARTGRRDCIELDAILDSWDGKLTALWRKRVNRHVEGCDICSERKREVLSPAMLLSVLPLVPLPAGLRDHLMRLVCDDSAEAVGYRGRVVSRAGAFDPAGFPVQVASVAVPGRSGRGRGGPGADGSGSAGAAGGSAAGGSAAGRRHAGERSMLVLLAAAGALVLLLGGGVATTYALLAGHGHAKATVHRKDLAGAISTTAPPAPPSSPSAVPPPSPSPPPVSAPTEPAVVPTTAPPKTSPPAKSPTPTPTKSASPSPSPSPSPSTTVPIPPPTSSTPPVSSSPPVSPTTSAAAARGLGMIEAIDSLRLT